MSVLYYANGTQWWCRRCKTTVRSGRDGTGMCRCESGPSPWEPVCRKCLHIYRSHQYKRGLKRIDMPFSGEKIWRLTLFGWTAEWAYGSCKTDTSRISAATDKEWRQTDNGVRYRTLDDGKRVPITVDIPEKVQLAALGEIEARSKKGMKPGEFPINRLNRGTSRRRG